MSNPLALVTANHGTLRGVDIAIPGVRFRGAPKPTTFQPDQLARWSDVQRHPQLEAALYRTVGLVIVRAPTVAPPRGR